MILPDSIAPFPVSPVSDAAPVTTSEEDFVSPQAVRKVLLGTLGELPVEGLPAVEFVGFAARVPVPERMEKPGEELSEPFYYEDQPLSVHPAFVDVPDLALPRRARAPLLQSNWEESLTPVSRATDLWWMFALLLTLSSVLSALTFHQGTRAQMEALSQPFLGQPELKAEVPALLPGPSVANLR
jgi:hypothetical protein